MIIKSLGFSHNGHFYKCENGHTFVITECGGAMQESRCPGMFCGQIREVFACRTLTPSSECGEPIGGRGHQLNSTNMRDDEMEQLSRVAGVQASQWTWRR